MSKPIKHLCKSIDLKISNSECIMEKNSKQIWQMVKFTLFSISAGIIQVASFAILEIFIKDYWVPYLISLVLSIIWNFTLNRRYTFKSAANVPVAISAPAINIEPAKITFLFLNIFNSSYIFFSTSFQFSLFSN